MAVNTTTTTTTTKINGVKPSLDKTIKKPQKLGLLTRNSRPELEGVVVNSQKKIYDAIAAASIFTNCAGIDTSNSQVITMSTFMKFLETRQMEVWTEEDVKSLIQVLLLEGSLRFIEGPCFFLEARARRGAEGSELLVLRGLRSLPDGQEQLRVH